MRDWQETSRGTEMAEARAELPKLGGQAGAQMVGVLVDWQHLHFHM